MDLEKEVRALRQELNEVKTQLRDADVINLIHRTSPWQFREHMQWNPDDPTSVERFKIALGDKYKIHEGFLRIETTKDGLVDVVPGDFITFEPAKWTPIKRVG